MKCNILITGIPGVGKTTLINKLLEKKKFCKGGFYTHEKREKGKRVGFFITDFDGNQDIMADINSRSPYRVGKYGVNISAFEKIGIPALLKAKNIADLIVIDEIGKMELSSKKFCQILEKIFDCKIPLLASIKKRNNELTSRLKKRNDIILFEITKKNRNNIITTIDKTLRKCLNNQK